VSHGVAPLLNCQLHGLSGLFDQILIPALVWRGGVFILPMGGDTDTHRQMKGVVVYIKPVAADFF
jgi:hypothetical protein